MAEKNFADALNQVVNGTGGLKPQIDAKADKNSPNFTGTPTAPTADNDTDSTQLATTEFVQNLIRRLVGAAPETLDTLAELATAINTDPNFAQTIVQALDGKLNKTDASTTYLSKTDASSTYATKSELSNVSIDTSNLAKLNAANTFTNQINVQDYAVNLMMAANCAGTSSINKNGVYIVYGGEHGQLTLKTGDGVQIMSNSKTYTFKSDGIYLGGTKITN